MHDAEQLNRLLYLKEVEEYDVNYLFAPHPYTRALVSQRTIDLLAELFENEPKLYGDEFWH